MKTRTLLSIVMLMLATSQTQAEERYKLNRSMISDRLEIRDRDGRLTATIEKGVSDRYLIKQRDGKVIGTITRTNEVRTLPKDWRKK